MQGYPLWLLDYSSEVIANRFVQTETVTPAQDQGWRYLGPGRDADLRRTSYLGPGRTTDLSRTSYLGTGWTTDLSRTSYLGPGRTTDLRRTSYLGTGWTTDLSRTSYLGPGRTTDLRRTSYLGTGWTTDFSRTSYLGPGRDTDLRRTSTQSASQPSEHRIENVSTKRTLICVFFGLYIKTNNVPNNHSSYIIAYNTFSLAF